MPTDADGAVDEEQLESGQAQGEVEDVEKGTTKSVELDLTPGRYVVFCNIVEEICESIAWLNGSKTVNDQELASLHQLLDEARAHRQRMIVNRQQALEVS